MYQTYPFWSTTTRFRVTGHFEMNQMTRLICFDCHKEHIWKVWLKKNHKCRRSSILKADCFGKIASAPYNPKITLITARSKLPHHATSLPRSQIWLCFTLRLAVSKIFAIFHFTLVTLSNFNFFFFFSILNFRNSKKQLLCGLSKRNSCKKFDKEMWA